MHYFISGNKLINKIPEEKNTI